MDIPTDPSHLFISYADEDAQLASWIARKLAAMGYAVWFDRMKMLGGEPWPQTIDDAIRHRTFRMLALMSANSISKPNPTKERTLALRLGRQRSIPDFLITLKVDDAELDWQTTDISYISFKDGRAQGLRALLKKLHSIQTPRRLHGGALLASATYTQGENLVRNDAETVIANVARVDGIPDVVSAYRFVRGLPEDALKRLDTIWAYYPVDAQTLIALSATPTEYGDAIEETAAKYAWADCDKIKSASARDVIATVVIKTLQRRLEGHGFLNHPNQKNCFFLPETFAADGKLRFTGIGNKKTWLKIRGKATFFRVGMPKETNYHHYALRFRLGRGLDKSLWLQVTPTLFFFDGNGTAIVDKRVGPRRRRLTKSWWNNKWANRLLAAEELFIKGASDNDALMFNAFLRIESSTSLNEHALQKINDDAEDADQEELLADVAIQLDEDLEEGAEA